MQFGTGTRAAVEDRLTILPLRRVIITRAAACIPKNTALRLIRQDAVVVRLGDLDERRDVLDARHC